MRDDDLEDSRRIAPVWRRIMILLAVIAAVPVVLWSITVFVRAYVAPPTVPTFRPITASASAPAPDVAVTAAPARALAAIVRNAATEESKLPAATGSIVEARATATDARGPAPIAERRTPASDSLSAIPEANAASAEVAPAAPWPPAAAATPQLPTIAEVADDAAPAGEPIAGPVPLPPHRPHVFAMVPSGIPVPRPRPTAAGDTAPAAAPVELNLSSRDYMK